LKKNLGLKLCWIPDTQVKAGVPLDHLTWIGRYILDKRPDVIVHAGDHWDMPSLSSYDVGKKSFEGRTYKADIAAGNLGMDMLMAPLDEYNAMRRKNRKAPYEPRKEFLLGNHEERIARAIELDRKLDGTIGYHEFNLEKHGWNVNGFRRPINIGGVYFAHYFYNPLNSRPYTGKAHTILKNLGFSFVQGHRQGYDPAGVMHLSNGDVRRGIIAGSCYQHEERYLGPQGENYWRGILMLHELKNGNFNLMEVSLDFLREKYS
jgi:hypothetical protein